MRYDGIASDWTVWGNFRFPQELQASKNRFSFTGYIWDKETSLFFAKARFYDPELGRFISQDSFLGNVDEPPSLHRYSYAHNRPTFYVDPTGHAVVAGKPEEKRKTILAVGSTIGPRNEPCPLPKLCPATRLASWRPRKVARVRPESP